MIDAAGEEDDAPDTPLRSCSPPVFFVKLSSWKMSGRPKASSEPSSFTSRPVARCRVWVVSEVDQWRCGRDQDQLSVVPFGGFGAGGFGAPLES